MKILHRDGRVLYKDALPTVHETLVAAVRQRADLRYADLGDANLGGADLRYANLGDANLRDANLGGADLRCADLGDANLRCANLRYANLGGADLRYANLGDADLRYANLGGANLRGADLRDARLETGETLDEYVRETAPALLKAGGNSVPASAWTCHAWDNCPMATAFGVHETAEAPRLHQPRIAQFIRLFDDRVISGPPNPDGSLKLAGKSSRGATEGA